MRYKSFTTRLQSARQAASGWEERLIGTSEEGRPIVAFVQEGSGPRILAWALMHGNEPTGYEALVQLLGSKVQGHWCVIPVLNPDGAEAFTRVNACGVDVNRDARDQVSAEAKALEACRTWFQPDIALNLHDQRPRFYPEGGDKPASFSLLAPKGHPEGITASQRQAQSILHHWALALRKGFPGQVARFDDSFYPTAFGEYFQETGCATITFETGISPKDWERKTVAFAEAECLRALDAHASHWLNASESSAYTALPLNASPANEWILAHPGGHCHLRVHESVSNGEYRVKWEVDTFHAEQPTWLRTETSTSLDHLELGAVLDGAYLASLGISAPETGLKN